MSSGTQVGCWSSMDNGSNNNIRGEAKGGGGKPLKKYQKSHEAV